MGIRSRIYLLPLIVAVLAMGGLHLYWNALLQEHQREHFFSRQRALLATLSEVVVDELVEGHRERIREVLDRSLALNGPAWRRLELRDLDGVLLYPEKAFFPEEGARWLRVRHTLFDGEIAVGQLILDVDPAVLREETASLQGRFEALALVVVLLALAVAMSLQHAALLRPLTSLGRAARAMARGDLSSPVPPGGRLLNDLSAALGELRIRLSYSNRETERALQLSRSNEERFRLLFEHIAEGIVAVGENGQIASVNPASLQLFGCSEDELIGLHASRLMSDESWRRYCAFLLRFLSSGEEEGAGHIELEAQRRDGAPLWVELTISVVQDQEQRLLIWIVRDIGLRKEAERAREAARLAAEEAARAKSEFLATMSHEIRTPLAGLLGMMELLGETRLEEEQRRYLETMVGSGRVLLAVINDILDFSRIESGGVTLERIPLDLERLCAEVLRLMAPQGAASGVELALEYDARLPRGWLGDPVRLRQVLLNLVSNAVKFTERGAVIVRVEALDPGGVAIEVEDTGIGIPEEAMARLFDQFTQADTSTTRRYGGTGLGLAICKRLVELMEGRISVRSRVGEGSCFRVELPLEEAAGPLEESERPPRGAPLEGRVLVVDDNPVNRRLTAAMLEHLGVEAAVAEGGREALARLERERVDLVLMDCCMPDVDGVEATRLLMEGGGPVPPVVAMTASVSEEQRRACRSVGMVGVLAKPFSLADLHRSLAPWLAGGTRPPRMEERQTVETDGLYDLSRLRLLHETMGEDFRHLSAAFSDSLGTQLEELRRVAAGTDREALRRLAHAIKSGAASVGAVRLAERASVLEEGAAHRCRDRIDRLVEEVECAAGETLAALDEALSAVAGGWRHGLGKRAG